MSIGRAVRFASERRDGRRHLMPAVFLHGLALDASHDAGAAVRLVCVDVSSSGCRVRRPRGGLAVGDLVALAFSPSGGAAPLQARVVRTARDPEGRMELGLAFEDAGAAERTRVHAFAEHWSRPRRPGAVRQADEVGLRDLNAALRASRAAGRRRAESAAPDPS